MIHGFCNCMFCYRNHDYWVVDVVVTSKGGFYLDNDKQMWNEADFTSLLQLFPMGGLLDVYYDFKGIKFKN